MHANYLRIERALKYITANAASQPTLDAIAAHVNLSPFHFHRLFVEWVGLSPKEFLSYCTLNRAKQLLAEPGSRIVLISEQVGFSSPSRLHDLFVKIEGTSPGDFRNGNFAPVMHYSLQDSVFGEYLAVSSDKGLTYLAFTDDEACELERVRLLFPGVLLVKKSDDIHRSLQLVFENRTDPGDLKLHLLASPFRLKVWEALLKISPGRVCTYAGLARSIGSPGAARAVGNAVASNPVAFLIPCHRVILNSGAVGNYRWGPTRKNLLLAWEASKIKPSGI